jgi:transposase
MPATLDEVRTFDTSLQAEGQALSISKIAAHFRVGKENAKRLLEAYREAQGEAAPPDPASAPPLPLLQQAESDLQAALLAERMARRDYDFATTQERDQCHRTWQQATRPRERAAIVLDQRRRAV